MPTFEKTVRFENDYRRLTPQQREHAHDAVRSFVADLSNGQRFRPNLRVKRVQGRNGVFEMTWEAADGRATFEYGESKADGEPHIVWRRIGTHDIYRDP